MSHTLDCCERPCIKQPCAKCRPAPEVSCTQVPIVYQRCNEVCQAHIPAASLARYGTADQVLPAQLGDVFTLITFTLADFTNSHQVFTQQDANRIKINKPGKYAIHVHGYGSVTAQEIAAQYNIRIALITQFGLAVDDPVDIYYIGTVIPSNAVSLGVSTGRFDTTHLLSLASDQVPAYVSLGNASSSSVGAVVTPQTLTLHAANAGGSIESAKLVIERIDTDEIYVLAQ